MIGGSERRGSGGPEAEAQLPSPEFQRPLGSSLRHVIKS